MPKKSNKTWSVILIEHELDDEVSIKDLRQFIKDELEFLAINPHSVFPVKVKKVFVRSGDFD